MKSDIAPFKMFGEMYFVGSSKVSVHIINTEEGLVMIDTGYPEMYGQIIESIESLGFSSKDICAIFHSHGHYDHFGCTREFKALSGAKTYISKIDNDIVNGTYDLSWAKELGRERLPAFDCDVLVEDGDVFTFGSTTVRCVLTPGHTDGVLAASFKTAEQVHKCALCGCHSVTVTDGVLKHLISHPMTDAAIDGFKKDWKRVYGDKRIEDFS